MKASSLLALFFSLCCSGTLNLDKMREAAELLIGEHDFSSFTSKHFVQQNMSCVKTLDKIEISEVSPPDFPPVGYLPTTRSVPAAHFELECLFPGMWL